MSRIIKFPSYRLYEEARVEMNDAVMATLVSLELAKNAIETVDDNKMTVDLFPDIKNIKRMHLSVGSTRSLLVKTNSHLAIMAIPYVLSLHEDYMMTCLKILQRAGLINRHALDDIRSNTMHEDFENVSGINLSTQSLEQFHMMRLIRNSFIHNGGLPSSDLISFSQTMSIGAASYWKKLTGRRPGVLIKPGQKIRLDYGEILLALAITKNIAQDVNIALRSSVSRTVWSDIFYEDFLVNHTKMNSKRVALRKVSTYARQFYDALIFSESEKDQLADRLI